MEEEDLISLEPLRRLAYEPFDLPTDERVSCWYVARVKAGVTAEKSREILDETTLLKEKVAFGLRMASGVDSNLLAPWEGEKQHLLEIGLLQESGSRVRLTRRGRMLADSVGEAFMG